MMLSKKSGIKCLSSCGIEKIKEIVNNKIKVLSENLSYFYNCQNSKSLKYMKTLTSKMISDFLEIEGINITNYKE